MRLTTPSVVCATIAPARPTRSIARGASRVGDAAPHATGRRRRRRRCARPGRPSRAPARGGRRAGRPAAAARTASRRRGQQELASLHACSTPGGAAEVRPWRHHAVVADADDRAEPVAPGETAGPVGSAGMSGSSIAGPTAALWVTDFLNAAYYARDPAERSLADLRLARSILATGWHRAGYRRLTARDLVGFHRAFGRDRFRADGASASGRLTARSCSPVPSGCTATGSPTPRGIPARRGWGVGVRGPSRRPTRSSRSDGWMPARWARCRRPRRRRSSSTGTRTRPCRCGRRRRPRRRCTSPGAGPTTARRSGSSPPSGGAVCSARPSRSRSSSRWPRARPRCRVRT